MTIALKKKADALVAKLTNPTSGSSWRTCFMPACRVNMKTRLSGRGQREIDRRLDEYEAGKVEAIPSREVHAGVRRKLNEIKARRIFSRRTS